MSSGGAGEWELEYPVITGDSSRGAMFEPKVRRISLFFFFFFLASLVAKTYVFDAKGEGKSNWIALCLSLLCGSFFSPPLFFFSFPLFSLIVFLFFLNDGPLIGNRRGVDGASVWKTRQCAL